MTPAMLTVVVDGQWRSPDVTDITWTDVTEGSDTASVVLADRDVADRLRPEARAVISDPVSGQTIWSGSVRDPGSRSVEGRRDGRISLSGSRQLLYDERVVAPYVISGPESWVDEDQDRTKGAGVEDVKGEVAASAKLDGADVTKQTLSLKAKGEWTFGDRVRARCTAFENADLTVGSIHYDERSGFSAGTAANWISRVIVGDPVYGAYPEEHNPPAPWLPGVAKYANASNPLFPMGQHNIRLELHYQELAPITITQESFFTRFSNLTVMATRVNRDGTVIPLSSPLTALPEQIVDDVIGRCAVIDSARSNVTAGTTLIDQLNFDSPTAWGDILTELALLETGFRWRLNPSKSLAHPLDFGPWGTTARYVLPQSDGVYEEKPRDDEVYSHLSAVYRDQAGRLQKYTRTADPDIYPAVRRLFNAGVAKREPDPIDLGSSSLATAVAVTRALLDEWARPRVAATYGTSRPVLDRHSGVYVHPWLVRPGWLAYVPETGETHRITQAVGDGITGTTNLTLGTPVKTTETVMTALRRRIR